FYFSDVRLATNSGEHFRFDLFWQIGQAGAGKIELHAMEAVTDDCVEHLFQSRPNKSFCEDSELHILRYTPPVTSARRIGPPVSTDRAMATNALMAATPSSMLAPCCGVPFRMVSAKPSTWRL